MRLYDRHGVQGDERPSYWGDGEREALHHAATIPRASFVTIPGAGHAVHIEHPEAIAALLAAFLHLDQ